MNEMRREEVEKKRKQKCERRMGNGNYIVIEVRWLKGQVM